MVKSLRLMVILGFTALVLAMPPFSGVKTVNAVFPSGAQGDVPPIPEAKKCVDMNFETTGVVRVGINPDRADQINCRVIAQNGSYFSFFGAPLTTPAQIGSEWLSEQGIVQAIEIFSPDRIDHF